ncbi:MAG: 30S ribosomal protein S10 [Candidatus Hodgkinia cicadicola]
MRIRLRSYNNNILSGYVNKLVLVFSVLPCVLVKHPSSLPTKITKYTVNKSPHIDKKSRDQLEIRTYTKLIEIYGEFNFILSKLFNIEQKAGILMELMLTLSVKDSQWLAHGPH